MRDLQQRIDQLRRQIDGLQPGADAAQLERSARDLLSDAKNTRFESEAQALFAQLAQFSDSVTTKPGTGGGGGASNGSDDPVLRGLLRRARIRIEMAGDADDIDDAIDILTEALVLDPNDGSVIELLQKAAAQNGQAAQRVRDLFNRYGINAPTTPEAPSRPVYDDPETDGDDAPPRYPSSSAPDVERGGFDRAASDSSPDTASFAGLTVDDMLSQMTDKYYEGDYQQTIDIANRILNQEAGNLAAQEFRQKAEDNLIRGIVPDHRIPFEARVAYNRANSLVRAGNYDEAANLYREARELAERSGILSWKDVEQALLDIQDLALARELLNEGDRLMSGDAWGDALRKYEGALRVVPNDPQAEERIETVRRVQRDADQVAVSLNMLSGTLEEQVAQIIKMRNVLAQIRQLLPGSARLSQLQADIDSRANGIKIQLNEQAQSALARVRNATSLEDRLILTNEAIKLMEAAVELDPADTSTSETMMEARAAAADLSRSRQAIERASSLISQNFDAELTQARTLLASLTDKAQDERYRMVVNELLSRYMERAEIALEDGDLREAREWLDVMREDPFRILGRRTEIYRLEAAIRGRQNRQRAMIGGIGGIILLVMIGALFAARPQIEAAFFPSPTPSYTPTLTATSSPTPSDTPTPSWTPTASLTPTITNTPTWTWTPSPTVTPSWTPTASLTPTHTNTPTHTHTPSPSPTTTLTPTPTSTSTVTLTPSWTPTPRAICRLIVAGPTGIFLREEATTSSPVVRTLPISTSMDAIERRVQVGTSEGPFWYRVRVDTETGQVFGWVRIDTVTPITDCPPIPGQDEDDE